MRSIALLVCCLAVGVARGDTTMLIRTVESPGGADVTRTVWIGDERIRQDAHGQSMIVDLAADKVVVLDHASATYQVFDLPLELDDLVPPEQAARLRAEMAKMAMEIEIHPTDERREIRSLPCRRQDVVLRHPEGMRIDVELWTTEAVEFDVGAYKRMEQELATVQSGGAEWMKRLVEIEGFPVLREMVIHLPSGQEASQREELVSIETRPAPDGIYEPPEDYELRSEAPDEVVDGP
jgi:hypothetical protein